MPLPEPQNDENEEDFMDRCVSADIMQDEFDDQDEIIAVCADIWEQSENGGDNSVDRNKKMEVRKVKSSFEVRQDGESEEEKIVGYAAVTNSEAPEQMGFKEKIAEGAFADAIANSDVRALFNHNPDKILARKSAGTLELKEDDTGLHYEIKPPDTTYANDLMESLGRGDIDESSFSFTVSEEKWDESKDIPVRTILGFEELFDVGPVTRGWYPQTESEVKSAKDVLKEYRNRRKDKDEHKSLDLFKKKIKINQRSVL